MKVKLNLLLLFLCNVISAQLTAVDYKSDEFNQFKGSKTYFVMSGNANYDNEIIQAANDLWKATPFESIKLKDLGSKINDETASFVMLITIDGRKPGQNYHYLGLLNGGKKSLSKYNYDDLLSYCPINFFLNENKLVDCNYRVRNMLESMIQSIEIVQKNDFKGSSFKIAKELQTIYLSKSSKIKDRTLLICQEAIGKKISSTDIAGVYPYKFEICSEDKIRQVIKNKSTDYYYLQPGITLNKSIFVFDPSNGEVVYFDYAVMGLAFNKKDLKNLVEAIQGK
jgi:hypothetical protein